MAFTLTSSKAQRCRRPSQCLIVGNATYNVNPRGQTPNKCPVPIKTGILLIACGFAVTRLSADEVPIYDCDYSDRGSQLGLTIALAGDSFPLRTECSSIIFGDVVVEPATAPWTGTAAIMRPAAVGNSLHYSQMEFWVTGGVYAFRKHRIETIFHQLTGF